MPKLKLLGKQEQTFTFSAENAISEEDKLNTTAKSPEKAAPLYDNAFQNLQKIEEEELQYDDLIKEYSDLSTRITKKDRSPPSQPRVIVTKPEPSIEDRRKERLEAQVKEKENVHDLANSKLASSLLDEQLFSMKSMNEVLYSLPSFNFEKKLEKSGLSFKGSEERKEDTSGLKKALLGSDNAKANSTLEEEVLVSRLRNFSKYVGEIEKDMQHKNLMADPYKISLDTMNPIRHDESSSRGLPQKEADSFNDVRLSSAELDIGDDLQHRLQRMKLRFFDSYLPEEKKVQNSMSKLMRHKLNLKSMDREKSDLMTLGGKLDLYLGKLH